ncbi:unnamed protein product, partial [Darwinula stevensoni]
MKDLEELELQQGGEEGEPQEPKAVGSGPKAVPPEPCKLALPTLGLENGMLSKEEEKKNKLDHRKSFAEMEQALVESGEFPLDLEEEGAGGNLVNGRRHGCSEERSSVVEVPIGGCGEGPPPVTRGVVVEHGEGQGNHHSQM